MKLPLTVIKVVILSSLMLFLFFASTFAFTRYRPNAVSFKTASDCREYVEYAVHDVGKIGLTVANMGHFGKGFLDNVGVSLGPDVPSCKYPYPGNVNYMFSGCFWIGAIVGRDTLVSVGADGWHYTMEMWPAPYPESKIIRRSLSNPEDLDAVSEQDFISTYVDTVTDPSCVIDDDFDNRPHKPLNIRVVQRSYAWSYSYAEDFVLFDYSIENIGRKKLEKVYMGIYVDGHVGLQDFWDDAQDDICGFRRTIPAVKDCPGQDWLDTINIAWIADCDGKRNVSDLPPCPEAMTLTGVTGTRVIRTPSTDTLKYSFNWWVSNVDASLDFGPRQQDKPDDRFRDFGGNLGTPMGDRNKYYILRHEEFDYDQLFCAKDNTADGWTPPTIHAPEIADGYDTRYLLSFGPFDIQPGEVLPITLAYIAGEDFHSDCSAYENLFDAYHPEKFYEYFNFNDLGKNAMWASWIYDNPGVDTDGNGYKGPMRFCNHDSVWVLDSVPEGSGKYFKNGEDSVSGHWEYTVVDTIYTAGDGVPDFMGASPPPPPELWVVDESGDTLRSRVEPRITETGGGELRIRWNGKRSETTVDRFSGLLDFEGYRVYLSLSPHPDQFYVIASYDREDYNRYTWTGFNWDLPDIPFTLDSLRKLYGDNFNPLDYDIDHHFSYVDDDNNSAKYYFTAQDYNYSDLSDPNGIHKVYPDEPPPSTLNPDSARIYYPDELTPDGLFFKYYEYEYILKDLLPSQLYYVAVTAFDFGSPGELASLETPEYKNYVAEYPANTNTAVERQKLDVIVYPNPWRIDGHYKDFGFEARDYIDGANRGHLVVQEDLPDERTNSIHFLNLPHKCTIRIFTIDGDLVREIKHDYPKDSPRSMHERWDIITRNTQTAVSGIYYYSVESEYGNQIGKIVIIM